jgi:hypothetical protein
MPVSPLYSAQYAAALVTEPTVRQKSSDWGGKVRMSYAKLTLTAAGQGDAKMLRLPMGRVRIYTALCRLIAPQGAASSTISVGYAAHVNEAGATVNASVAALIAATATSSAPANAGGSGVIVELSSRSGVDITITAAGGNTAASGDVEVVVAYSVAN